MYSKPIQFESSRQVVYSIEGGTDTAIGFEFFTEQPKPNARRYNNKVLVHECIQVPSSEPLEITSALFLATSDTCYGSWDIRKNSNIVGQGVELILNDDDLVTSVVVNFFKGETQCTAPRLAFRLYGFMEDGVKILLAQGSLFITPQINAN